MSEIIAIKKDDVYGAFELKKLYPRNFSIGLGLAIFLHLLAIGSYYFVLAINKEDDLDNERMVRIMKYSELGPPPSITNEVPPQIAVSGTVARPTIGVPVPVPDTQVSPEQTIASQEEMSQAASSSLLGEGLGTGQEQITQDIKIEKEEEPDINAFIPYEKVPEVVIAPKLEYPELAKRSGITGRVTVKVLIDKEGKPKRAVILKSDSELFNQAAIDAVMRSVFTPALQNNRPVAVWIAVPYRFSLHD